MKSSITVCKSLYCIDDCGVGVQNMARTHSKLLDTVIVTQQWNPSYPDTDEKEEGVHTSEVVNKENFLR